MRLSHHENFCSEDRFWPKHYAARRGAAFPFYHQNALQDPDRQTSIKKEPFALCSWQRKWWSQNAKPLLSPGWRGLGWQSGYCSSKWTESILYLTPCLLWHFSGKIGLQAQGFRKWEAFSRDKEKEETKSYKLGEQRSYVSILSVSKWPLTPGCQGNKSTPQARSIIPNYPLFQWKGESHTLAKACHSQYDSKLLLRKVEN